MVKTELRQQIEDLVGKIEKQQKLIEKKIDNVNVVDAAKDPNLYEKFMPIVDEYQDDLTILSSAIYSIIESLNDKLSIMFDSISDILDNTEEVVEDNTEEVTEEDFNFDLGTDEVSIVTDITFE